MLGLLLAAGSCSGQKGMPSGHGGKDGDTVVVAERQKTFTLNEGAPQIELSMPVAAPKAAAGGRYFLTLRNVRQQEAPDGAYELYLSAAPLPPSARNSESPGFVTVLDTYLLGSETSKRDLRFDVSRAAAAALNGRESGSLWLTIHFRGNGLPGGGESRHSGQLTIDGVNLKALR